VSEKSLRGTLLRRQIGGALMTKKKPSLPAVGNNQTKSVEVFILAGGLSTRMGRDKSKIRLCGRSLLAWVRAAARETGWPVRVIRRDLVPRCGPLGGVWTALLSSRADRLVFLSCDMPFVTAALIRAVAGGKGRGAFIETEEGAGFPFAIDREAARPFVEAALEGQRFSLQAFARSLRASRVQPSLAERVSLQNLNTPEDCAQAKARLER
jgi:molybdopterin-guanine dinucleotide biosynthesis protein A